ncbi:MAG TPA: hypothetical protein VFY14_11395 [Streptomyces sp.]|nr:hypothetical protein [Streptomyces sp.]
MRLTVAGTAVVMAVALLTGCGGDDGKTTEKDAAASSAPGERSKENETGGDAGDGDKKDGEGGEVTREVTFEVDGEGQTQVYYTADTTATERVTLPWKKTVEVPLRGAELKVGVPVSILPGSVSVGDGTYKIAPCVIKVDGKQVVENPGGESDAGCEHMLK